MRRVLAPESPRGCHVRALLAVRSEPGAHAAERGRGSAHVEVLGQVDRCGLYVPAGGGFVGGVSLVGGLSWCVVLYRFEDLFCEEALSGRERVG